MARDPRDDGTPFVPKAGSGPLPNKQRGNPKLDRLNAMFNSGNVQAPGPKAGAASLGSSTAMGSKMRIERLRSARDSAEVVASIDALMAVKHLPDEPELLCKMTRHPDAAVGEQALAELAAIRARMRIVVTPSMKEELRTFEPRCKDPTAHAFLEDLLKS